MELKEMYFCSQGFPKILARIEQIRKEECSDLLDREVAHENKLHSAMRISQSWDDLTIMVESPNKVFFLSFQLYIEKFLYNDYLTEWFLLFYFYLQMDDESKRNSKNKDGVWEPLNINLSNCTLTAPSPTRCPNLSRQCYSPGLLKFNSSPSPTRKTFATRFVRAPEVA